VVKLWRKTWWVRSWPPIKIGENAFNICPKKDIKILCSINSKTKVSGYFTELENDKLPGKINFLTSAYFTGFDLNEPYHLISVSGNKSKIHALSDKRLKQIAGRCRVNNGLLSETIIHDIIDKSKNSKVYSIDEIIQAAEIQLKALKCLEENYKKVPLLSIILEIPPKETPLDRSK
jgi:hypothetical protein